MQLVNHNFLIIAREHQSRNNRWKSNKTQHPATRLRFPPFTNKAAPAVRNSISHSVYPLSSLIIDHSSRIEFQ